MYKKPIVIDCKMFSVCPYTNGNDDFLESFLKHKKYITFSKEILFASLNITFETLTDILEHYKISIQDNHDTNK